MRPTMRRGFASVIVAALLAACGGGSEGASVEELESAGDVAALIEVAASGGFDDRPAQAVEALRRLDDPTTVPMLAEALRTEAYASGEYAAPRGVIEVLGAVGGPAAAQAVLDEARAADPMDTSFPEDAVVWALTAIGADSYELLAPLVEAPVPAPTDPAQQVDAVLRRVATAALGGRAADDPDPFRRDVQLAVPTSTGPLGSDRAELALVNALGVEPQCTVTTALVFSCTSWGEAASVALVLRRRSEPASLLPLLEYPATARVAHGLVLLGDPATEPALVAALQRTTGGTPLGESMMSTFANSGNPVLEDAALEWRMTYGYTQQGPWCPAGTTGGECEAVSLWGTIDDESG